MMLDNISNMRKNIIFWVTYIAYTMIYVARLNLSVASPSFIEEAILDSAGIGLLGGVFSIIYAGGRLINGYIADRQPPRRMIGIGLGIVGISNILMGTLPGVAGLAILWGLNAFAQSMLWGAVLRTVSAIYDTKTAKKKTSYMVTSVAAGNIIGILFNTFIINSLGFRFAFIVPGMMSLVFAAVVFFVLRGAAEKSEIVENKEHISALELFKDKVLQRVLVPAFLHGIIKDNISVWMTVYFVDKFEINLAQSAGFVLFIPVVGFIGRLLYPMCYRLCRQNEHKVSVYSFIACVLAAGLLCTNFVSPIVATLCLSILYAAVSLTNTTILSIFPLQFAKTGNVASVSGIMDFATYFGAGVSSLAYGVIIKNFGYLPMYASWVLVSIISIIILIPLAFRKREEK